MKNVANAETSIAAPIEIIWEIMLDLKNYAAWNPFITNVLGCDRITTVGQRFRLNVTWSNRKEIFSDEQVTILEAPENGTARLAYTFTGWMSNIFLVRAQRVQTLRVMDAKSVLYCTEERFTGWGAPWIPLEHVIDGFDRHANALKIHAEEKYQAENQVSSDAQNTEQSLVA